MKQNKPVSLFIVASMLVLAAACGGRALDNKDSASGITGGGDVSVEPKVMAISPSDTSTGNYTDTSIEITFNIVVDVGTVTLPTNTDCQSSVMVSTTADFNNGDCIIMNQLVSQDGTKITVRPASLLTATTPYYVRVTTAVKNATGLTMLSTFDSQFTTGGGFGPLAGAFGADCTGGADTMEDVRAAADGALTPSLTVPGLTVTAIDKDSYFFVQVGATATGPAILIRDSTHKASALGVQVGDVVCMTMDERYDYSNLQRIGKISAIQKTNAGQTITPQVVIAAVVNDDYQAELVNMTGTLTTKSTEVSGGGYNHVLTYAGGTIVLREMENSGKLTNLQQGLSIEVTTVMTRFSSDYQLYIDSTVGSVSESTTGTFNVTGALAASTTTASLTFSNTPDAAAATKENYAGDNGLTISGVSVSENTATLTTSAQTPGQTYTITVSNVKRNADDAVLTTANAVFTGFVPLASFTTGQVVINEAHIAPTPSAEEFIELYNTTGSAISLNGATLWYKSSNGSPGQATTLTGTIAANSYYTVLRTASPTAYTCTGTVQDTGWGNTGLSNSAGAVILTVDGTAPTTKGDINIRDIVQWGTNTTDWAEGGNSASAPSAQKTLSRSPNGVDTNDNGNDFLLSAAANGTCGETNWAPDTTKPTVATANPASAAIDVALSPAVSVTFDEAMDVATVNGAFTVHETNCSGTLKSSGTPTASNGNKTFTYSLSGLTASTVHATCVDVGAKDVAGNSLAAPYEITWTTGDGSPPSGHLVISQVYGAGGNSGATYTNDYVEIFNPTASPISLNGMSLQYGSATSTASLTSVFPLSNVSVPAYTYYLVQCSGGPNGVALPVTADDATCTLGLAATNGKIVLVNQTEAISAKPPLPDAAVIDWVGFGTANWYEGTGGAPAPSTTNAIFRAGGGCTDTDDNAADFTAGAATPRNSSTPINTCP